MSLVEMLKESRLIGKLTASIVILGSLYAIFFEGGSDLLNNGAKDILLLVLGGAITLLFND